MMGEHSEVTEDMMQPALTDPLTTTVVTTKDANENNTKSGEWERSHLVRHIFSSPCVACLLQKTESAFISRKLVK